MLMRFWLPLRSGQKTGGSSGRNRNAALLLLGHPVHGSSALVGLANFIIDACVKQDTLCGGSFTGIDVSHDADVSG